MVSADEPNEARGATTVAVCAQFAVEVAMRAQFTVATAQSWQHLSSFVALVCSSVARSEHVWRALPGSYGGRYYANCIACLPLRPLEVQRAAREGPKLCSRGHHGRC